ncbi:hypothetical protein C9009_27700, partial (plasmid) [Escherichia coli]
GKTSIFSHPVYLFLREFSLQDFRGGSCTCSKHGKFFPYHGIVIPLLFSFSHINDGVYSDARVFRLCLYV